MTQVKTIIANSNRLLHLEINKWIEDNKDCKIQDIYTYTEYCEEKIEYVTYSFIKYVGVITYKQEELC